MSIRLTSRMASRSCVALLVGLLVTGCALMPTTPRLEPMPMMVSQNADGSLTATFPLCAGDAVDLAGVTVPSGQDVASLQVSSADGRAEAHSQVQLDINASTLLTGQLNSGLQVAEPLPAAASHDPRDVVRIFVYTIRGEVSVNRTTLEELGGDTWLARGTAAGADSTVERVSDSTGRQAIVDFCVHTSGSDR